MMGAPAPSAPAAPADFKPYQPEGPLNLSAQTSLGEDYFLLAPGLLDPVKDLVVAYRNAEQKTEAMVVQKGVLHQLTRNDAGAATTWSLDPVVAGGDGIAGVTDLVAGTPHDSSGRVGALAVVYRINGEVVIRVADGPGANPWATAHARTLPWDGSGPLRVNYSDVRGLFFYSFTSVRSDNTFTMYWTHQADLSVGNSTYGAGSVHFDNGSNVGWTSDPSTGRVHVAGTTLSVFFAKGDSVVGFLSGGQAQVSVGDIGQPSQSAKAGSFPNGRTRYTATPQGRVVSVNDVRHMDDTDPSPIVVVTTDNGQVWCASMSKYVPDPKYSFWFNDGHDWLWRWLWQPPWGQSHVDVAVGARPLAGTEHGVANANANKMLDIFVTQRSGGSASGHLLGVVRQKPSGNWQDDSEKPDFYFAQPLHAGSAVVSVPGVATPTRTLMTIADDGTLLVLEQDPTTTLWSETTVHIPATEGFKVTCHRVQVSITDARGMALPNSRVSVTAAAAVSALLSASNSTAKPPMAAAVTLSSTPITVISDGKGQVTIAVPASGLSAPDVTFEVSVPLLSAPALSAAVTVGPAGAVTAYLAGGPQLGPLPKLTATLLTQATTDTGHAIVPAKSPSTVSVSDVVGYFNGAAQAGIDATKKAKGLQASAKPRPFATDATPKRSPHQAGAGFESGLGDFFGDLLQAIQSGATQVKNVTVSTAEGWALTISTTVGDWSSQALTLVVSGLESAGHVFHALINAIGAEIMDMVHWLEAKILGVLTDTVALAANFDVWLSDWTSWMTTQIRNGEKSANAWFTEKIKDVDNKFDALIGDHNLANVTVGGPPPKAAPKGSLRDSAAPAAPSTAPPDPHHSWLHDKMTEHQVSPTKAPTPLAGSVADRFNTLVGHLKTNLETSFDSFESAGFKLYTTVHDIVDNPSQVLKLGVPALLTVIKDFINGVLELGVTIVDFTLDLAVLLLGVIEDFLNTPLPDVPIISSLLAKAKFQTPLTIGKVATLMMAFPAVVAYKVAHLDFDAAPFKGTVVNGRPVVKATAGKLGEDSQATALQDRATVAGYVTLAWSFFDAAALLNNALVPPVIESTYTPPALDFFGGIDLVAPCLLNALTYPTEDQVPFSGDLKAEKLIGNIGWLCGFGFPIITALGYHWKHQTGINPVQAAIIDRGLLAFTSIIGAAATFFNLDQAIIDGAKGIDPIALVLALVGDLGAAFAFLSESNLSKSTEGVSAAVAGVITLASGVTSAVLLPLDAPTS